MRRVSLAVLLPLMLGLLLFGGSGVASAQGEGPPQPSDDQINAIAKNLYCPVCENVPLDVCPTQACVLWRAQIGDLLSEGYSEQEIYDYFVAQYGDSVLASPPRRGLNWLIYVLPPAALLVGLYYLAQRWGQWRNAPVAARPQSRDDDYLRRVEEELEARR